MAKRTDIKKILIIGSGPIVIGQAAEFDYAGTQACLALKEEGYEVVLCNSNPATIMTDTIIADKVYMEPLTPFVPTPKTPHFTMSCSRNASTWATSSASRVMCSAPRPEKSPSMPWT